MSKIAITINQRVPAPIIISIAKTLKITIGEVKQRISQDRPIYEGTLFMNDHDDVAGLLNNIINTLKAADTPFRIYELDESEELSSLQRENNETSPDILENILMEWERRKHAY